MIDEKSWRSFQFTGLAPWLAMAALTAIIWFAAWLQAPVALPPVFDITITATGEKNPASGGTEVWAVLAPSTNARFTGGWEMRDGRILVSYQNQPAPVVLSLHLNATQPLQIAKNKTSGIITIEAGGRSARHDLYSEVSSGLTLDWKQLAAPADQRDTRLLPGLFLSAIAALCALVVIARPQLLASLFGTGHSQLSAWLFVVATWVLFAHFMAANIVQAEAAGFAVVMTWIFIVLAIQLAVANVFAWVSYDLRERYRFPFSAYDAVLALCFATNVNTLYFSPQSSWTLISTGVASAIAFLILVAAARQPLFQRPLAVAALIVVTFNTVAIVNRPATFEIARVTPASADTLAGKAGGKRPPNIYFVSLDALGSPSSLQDVLNEAGRSVFSILQANGFSVGHSRSPASSTSETFYQIFTGRKGVKSLDFLAGLDSNPILDRLRLNGYKVQSIQTSAFFGLHGSSWDYAWPERRPPLDFCWNVGRPKFMFGLCRTQLPLGMAHFDPIGQERVLAQRAIDVSKSTSPWFTFAHVLWPGHTWIDYKGSSAQRTEFIRMYNDRLQALAPGLADFVSEVAKNDPDAIIIIHGDHGPLLSKHVENPDKDEYWSLARMMRDRQEVTLAVRPKEVCGGRVQTAKTTADVLPALFDCLGLKAP